MNHRDIATLSRQQLRCLRLVGEGKTTPEIAHALGIAESTVNGYIAEGVSKLGVANRRQAGFIVLAATSATIPERLPGQNLRVDPDTSDQPDCFPSSVREEAAAPYTLDEPEGREVEHVAVTQPLRTITLIVGLVLALLLILLALKPLVQSARDIANAIQPDRPH